MLSAVTSVEHFICSTYFSTYVPCDITSIYLCLVPITSCFNKTSSVHSMDTCSIPTTYRNLPPENHHLILPSAVITMDYDTSETSVTQSKINKNIFDKWHQWIHWLYKGYRWGVIQICKGIYQSQSQYFIIPYLQKYPSCYSFFLQYNQQEIPFMLLLSHQSKIILWRKELCQSLYVHMILFYSNYFIQPQVYIYWYNPVYEWWNPKVFIHRQISGT